MARRMYDLDNGTENIKVKELVANKITAVTSAITNEYDDLVVNGLLDIKGSVSLLRVLSLGRYPTVQRPATGVEGSIIYDSTLKKCILWNGTAWVNLDGSPLSS